MPYFTLTCYHIITVIAVWVTGRLPHQHAMSMMIEILSVLKPAPQCLEQRQQLVSKE